MTSRILLVAGFAIIAITIGVETLRPVYVVVCLVVTFLVVRLSSRSLTMREVIFFAVVFRLLLLPALPSLSDDAFRYLWDGMVQWSGINPFLHVPADPELARFHDVPIFEHLNSPDYFTVYPPVGQALFWSSGWISPSSWQVGYIMMKGTAMAVEIAAVLFLARMVRPAALALYAWNPLVVVETAGQLHTEALMVFAIVLSVWAYRSARPRTAVAALTVAVWVKLYPVFLVPFLLRRVGWRSVWIVLAVSVIVATPYAHPDVIPNIASSLRLYVGLFEFYSGPYLVLKWMAYNFGGGQGLELGLGFMLSVLFIAFVARLFVMDAARRWSLSTVMVLVLAGFLVMTTTVHPWYFLGLFVLLPLTPVNPRPWIWLGAFANATYLLYSHDLYWPFVWIGWGGWAVMLVASTEAGHQWRSRIVQTLLERRARRKAQLVRPHLDDGTEELDRALTVLDLGSGEGYVGRTLQDLGDYSVTLCDIRSSNDTELPFVVYDGHELPFGDKWFDATYMIYTLHHCEDHVAVLREAARVTSGRLVILESVYRSEGGRRLLSWLDRWANRIRSHGQMNDYQHFRRMDDWVQLLENAGFEVQSVRSFGRLHRQALIVARV